MDLRYKRLTNGTTCVANMVRDRDLIRWAMDNGLFVYVGRLNHRFRMPDSMWRNPFRGPDAIANFKDYLLNNHELMSRLNELQGKLLVCWCYPNPCHGDILAGLANERE